MIRSVVTRWKPFFVVELAKSSRTTWHLGFLGEIHYGVIHHICIYSKISP